MKPLLSMAGAIALSLLIVAPASAQVTATFVMRSGERITGDLVDLNAQGLSAMVRGSMQVWPLGDVSVIDFVGGGTNFPADEVNKIGSQHLLVLRDGSTVVGRFVDVGGRNPKRINFESAGGDRDYWSNNVARIYMSAPPRGSAASGGGNGGALEAGSGDIKVSARFGWVSTGLQVGYGQTVYITANGEVRLSADPNDVAGPAGSKTGRLARNAPMPGTLAGALIGRVNNGPPFGIGDQTSFPAPGNGILYLTVNDDERSDNAGEFGVTVSLERQGRSGRQPR